MKKKWSNFYKKPVNLEFFIENTFVHREMFLSIYNENPKKILEVGIGSGAMSVFWSYIVEEVVALDNDKRVIKVAQELSRQLNGKVNFIFGDAFALPFPNHSFDLIFHQGLLEHFSDEDIIKLLTEQLRVAKSVVFSVPNNHHQSRDFGNERLLPKQYWDKLLIRNFQIAESKNYNPVRKKIFSKIPYKVVKTMYFAKIRK